MFRFVIAKHFFREPSRFGKGFIYSGRDLIRGANCRPRRSADISRYTLAWRIDRYDLAHKATECHDKVYALLGMSSDNHSVSGTIPDYAVPREQLFKRLVHFLLLKRNPYLHGVGVAIIRSNGCVLGQVTPSPRYKA